MSILMLQQEEEPIFLLKSFVSNIFLKDMDVDTLDKIGVSTSLICIVTSQRDGKVNDEECGSCNRPSGFESHFCHGLAVGSKAQYLSFLFLSFPI